MRDHSIATLCSAYGCNGQWAQFVSKTIPLCIVHFAQAWAAYENHTEWQDEEMAKRPNMHYRTRKRKPTSSVVYYVQMNEHVKIGTSTSFIQRMHALYVQPSEVLAIEPGGRRDEASRHQQFASYRVKGTELFRRCSVMDELIRELADKIPDPWNAAHALNYPPVEYEWKTKAEIEADQPKTPAA